jgi:tetratricopeptide (TPR) repeat protein
MSGDWDEVDALLLRACAVYESLAARPEARFESIKGLRRVYHGLGHRLLVTRRYSEAEPYERKAIEFAAMELSQSPTSPVLKHDYASRLEALGECLKAEQKWAEAEKTLREAIRIQEPLADQFPEQTMFREDLALSLSELGKVLRALGGHAREEEDVLRRSIAISKEIIGMTPKHMYRRVIVAQALIALAVLERDRGRLDASRNLLVDARSHVQAGLAINPLDPQLNRVNAELELDENAHYIQQRNRTRASMP